MSWQPDPRWSLRLWRSLWPLLPPGRLAIWAPPAALPPKLPCPPDVLPERYDLSHPQRPSGPAYQGLVVVATDLPPLPWAEFFSQLGPLAAPTAPLLLLTARGGVLQLAEPGWHALAPRQRWHTMVAEGGWHVEQTLLVGGRSWPHPAVTAACRVLICRRQGGAQPLPPTQLSSNDDGTAPATAPLAGAACRGG